MARIGDDLLKDILRDVSRSFYKTLRILPSSVRPQIGLAYLLARTTDTIADTELVPIERRLASLESYRERILGTSGRQLDFADLASHQGLPSERALLQRCEEALALLDRLDLADRQLVREVLQIITSGQELDLRRFVGASEKCIVALDSEEELDDYTYRVAGCVGEFWTRLCRLRVFPEARLNDGAMLTDGSRFGKGLQLVNILRDLPADLRQGRCYFPKRTLAAASLQPTDLLLRESEPALRPLYNTYLDRARGNLAAGWVYTNAIPWRYARIRLACAWPILIGLRTLEMLHQGSVLDPTARIKVSRPEVKRIIRKSVILYPWPNLWRKLAA